MHNSCDRRHLRLEGELNGAGARVADFDSASNSSLFSSPVDLAPSGTF